MAHRAVPHGRQRRHLPAINDDKGFAEDVKASYGREVYLALRAPDRS
jgi:hypothetical protein